MSGVPPPVRDVRGEHARGDFEHFHIELAHAAHAAAAVVELAGVLLGVVDEFLEGLERQAAVHHQGVGLAAQDGDVFEVFDRVVAHLGLRERVGQVAALRRHDQRVAVGLGARHILRAHRAARACAVLHHDGHAQQLGQRLGILARHDVHRPTGRERHHQRDGARGEFVLCPRGHSGKAGQADAGGQEVAAGGNVVHGCLQKRKNKKGE